MSDQPVPEGWTTTRVGDLVTLDNGFAFKPSHWKKAGLPIIRIQNLNNPNAPFNYCTDDVPARCFVEPNDLLFAWSGTPGTSFGAHIWRGEKAVLNQHIFNVRFDDTVTDRRFLRYAINQNLDEYIRVAHGGAGLAHITKGRFEESVLLIPPLPEQRRIVAKIEELFSDLDAGVAALERVRANLKRYRAAVLKAAVEGRLTEEWRTRHPATEPAAKLLERILAERRAKWEQDQLRKFKETGKTPPKGWKEKYKQPAGADHGSLHALPDGWTWAIADQLCSQVTDGEHIQPPYQTAGKPMLTATHVRDDGVRFENVGLIAEDAFGKALKRCAPTEGDLLIVSVGATTGRAGVVGPSEPFAIVRSVLLLKPLMSSKYLLRWVQSPWCNRWIGGASGATAQAHFYISDAKRMPVPLPPAAELTEIVAEVDRRLSVADAAETQVEHALQRAARLRQAILKRAFEGKLVPQDPTDEPAAALLERTKPATNGKHPAPAKPPIRRSRARV